MHTINMSKTYKKMSETKKICQKQKINTTQGKHFAQNQASSTFSPSCSTQTLWNHWQQESQEIACLWWDNGSSHWVQTSSTLSFMLRTRERSTLKTPLLKYGMSRWRGMGAFSIICGNDLCSSSNFTWSLSFLAGAIQSSKSLSCSSGDLSPKRLALLAWNWSAAKRREMLKGYKHLQCIELYWPFEATSVIMFLDSFLPLDGFEVVGPALFKNTIIS